MRTVTIFCELRDKNLGGRTKPQVAAMGRTETEDALIYSVNRLVLQTPVGIENKFLVSNGRRASGSCRRAKTEKHHNISKTSNPGSKIRKPGRQNKYHRCRMQGQRGHRLKNWRI